LAWGSLVAVVAKHPWDRPRRSVRSAHMITLDSEGDRACTPVFGCLHYLVGQVIYAWIVVHWREPHKESSHSYLADSQALRSEETAPQNRMRAQTRTCCGLCSSPAVPDPAAELSRRAAAELPSGRPVPWERRRWQWWLQPGELAGPRRWWCLH
jgi:hypothetical protein